MGIIIFVGEVVIIIFYHLLCLMILCQKLETGYSRYICVHTYCTHPTDVHNYLQVAINL